VSEIVDIRKFPPRRAGAPDHRVRGARNLRFVIPADQGGDDVAVFGVITLTAYP